MVSTMNSLLVALFALITSIFRTRAALQTEVLALRHQLAVLHANAPRRLRLKRSDRLLWVLLSRFWRDWRRCLQIVQPATVVAWHQEWKSSRAAAAKEALLIYNAEDCQALEVVSNSLLELGRVSFHCPLLAGVVGHLEMQHAAPMR